MGLRSYLGRWPSTPRRTIGAGDKGPGPRQQSSSAECACSAARHGRPPEVLAKARERGVCLRPCLSATPSVSTDGSISTVNGPRSALLTLATLCALVFCCRPPSGSPTQRQAGLPLGGLSVAFKAVVRRRALDHVLLCRLRSPAADDPGSRGGGRLPGASPWPPAASLREAGPAID